MLWNCACDVKEVNEKLEMPLLRILYFLNACNLRVSEEGVEGAAGGPPAQLRHARRGVGDQLVGGGQPRHQDLLFGPRLGAAVVPGDEGVNLGTFHIISDI